MKTLPVLLLLFPFLTVKADMGSIPFAPDAHVFEPNQDALIAWSGDEEVLLLATQLRASKPTKVLEVMPLPSKPTVTKGEYRSFVLANNLIRWKNGTVTREYGSGPFGAAPAAADVPAGRIEEVKRIGAHDLSITQVLDKDGFTAWALDYLKKHGAKEAVIPKAFATVIGEYLRDGFTWFVFDVVDLGPQQTPKDVLRFRFKSDFLYFPLRITRSERGNTVVKLMILTEGRIEREQFVGWPREKIKMTEHPVLLSGNEITGIDEHLWHVLRKPTGALLRTWEIVGALDSFDRDLMISRKR